MTVRVIFKFFRDFYGQNYAYPTVHTKQVKKGFDFSHDGTICAGLGTNCSNVREHELEFGSSRTSELMNTGFFESNEL